MTRAFVTTALLATLVAGTAFAQDEAQAEPAGAAAEEGSGEAAALGQVTINVELRRNGDLPQGEDGDFAVRLHIIEPPHDVIESTTMAAGTNGRATFVVDVRPGTEAVAEVSAGRRFFSDPVPLDEAGEQSIVIEAAGSTSDPSVLYAESVHTIIELWEGYLTVTEAWNLNTRDGSIFASTRAEDGRPDFATLARFPLPEAAEGINIIRPQGAARPTGTMISASLEIAPRGPGERRGADFVVQYSIKSHDARYVEWTQNFMMDVENYTLVVPQGSNHTRHPNLDVSIVPAPCDDPTQVCLTPSDDTSGIPLRLDVDMDVARGTVTAGQTLTVATTGWPHRTRWERKAATALAVLAALGALGLFARDRRSRPDDPRQLRIAALEAQRESLFTTAAELDRMLDDGLVLERDHELQMERIRQQLGVVYRRLREIDAGTESSASQ